MTLIAGNELLRGEKIRLTPITPEDVEIFARGFSEDIDMLRNLGFMPSFPHTLEDERSYYQFLLSQSDMFSFTIRVRENNQCIGNISLQKLDWQARQAEVGIVITDANARNQGYGTDTMRVMVRFGFMELGLNRIWLRVFSYNQRGMRAYEKVGFQLEGVIRASIARDQQYYDTHIMSILRREWQELNSK